MWPLLTGLETEYGLAVGGRGAEDQVEDAMALVRGCPDGRFVGWDYRFESPRTDLRGFKVDHLSFDPEDARFDEGHTHPNDKELRSDRILANGARFYNDHGHPEYATPECWSLDELVLHDLAGERFVRRACLALEESTGRKVKAYKNNSDFHGASYGTHESYLVPRGIGFERLYSTVCPVLLARQVVCGAGKTGSESGPACDFQISQRADFFTEAASVDTLYRRPLFNTRDEPHADPQKWARLHVISGDANRLSQSTARKVALVMVALWLEGEGQAPEWRVTHVAQSARQVSRDLSGHGRIELEGSWTTSREILESYVEAANRHLDRGYPGVDAALTHAESALALFDDLDRGDPAFDRQVDWAAKRAMLQSFVDDGQAHWGDPSLRSYDLAYHDVDPGEGLFTALVELDMVEPQPDEGEVLSHMETVQEGTRAWARSVAIRTFPESLVGVSWGTLTFETHGRRKSVALAPDACYPEQLKDATDLDSFLRMLEEAP